jgi:hypothetical protein
MNKNILLILITVGAVIMTALLFLSPNEEKNTISSEHVSKASSIDKNSIQIRVENEKENNITIQKFKQITKVKKKKDPSIKYIGMDHYRTYIIELIDKNEEDKNIRLTDNNYRIINGKIDGKQFIIQVPNAILNKSNLKLKFTNVKTQKSFTIDADFLNEVNGLPKNAAFWINIDSNNPGKISTQVAIPDGIGAFDGLQ